jgi:hypothetical protein
MKRSAAEYDTQRNARELLTASKTFLVFENGLAGARRSQAVLFRAGQEWTGMKRSKRSGAKRNGRELVAASKTFSGFSTAGGRHWSPDVQSVDAGACGGMNEGGGAPCDVVLAKLKHSLRQGWSKGQALGILDKAHKI